MYVPIPELTAAFLHFRNEKLKVRGVGFIGEAARIRKGILSMSSKNSMALNALITA